MLLGHPASRWLVRLMICSAIGSSVTLLGCSADVGSAPSAKREEAGSYSAKEADLAKEAGKASTKKGAFQPKSVKTKILDQNVPK